MDNTTLGRLRCLIFALLISLVFSSAAFSQSPKRIQQVPKKQIQIPKESKLPSDQKSDENSDEKTDAKSELRKRPVQTQKGI